MEHKVLVLCFLKIIGLSCCLLTEVCSSTGQDTKEIGSGCQYQGSRFQNRWRSMSCGMTSAILVWDVIFCWQLSHNTMTWDYSYLPSWPTPIMSLRQPEGKPFQRASILCTCTLAMQYPFAQNTAHSISTSFSTSCCGRVNWITSDPTDFPFLVLTHRL